MHPALELFLSIAKEYTDLTFGRSKDELISRSIKALRALREEDLEKVKKNKELSSGIEVFFGEVCKLCQRASGGCGNPYKTVKFIHKVARPM
jgi:hypothetical protein